MISKPNQREESRRQAKPRIPRVILLIESSRASGRHFLTGVANYARHHGPWAFYWEPAGLERAWPELKKLDAQGIMLRDVEGIEEVLRRGIPAIVLGHSRKEIPGLTNVTADSVTTGQMAAQHFLDRGLQHFAYCGYPDTPWSKTRGDSFARWVAARGYPTHRYLSDELPTRISWKSKLAAMARWLQSLPKPVGLMACNDDRGQHVIEACKIAGLRVPDEVAVIGADNDELVCELSEPRLSSIAINFERAGYESARVLDQLMKGHRAPRQPIIAPPTHLVTRQSTDIFAIPDLGVAKALRFIRDHARKAIQVNNVAGAAGVSRRVLEKRFQRLLARSVGGEIRAARVDQIGRMLVETNQSVSEIAAALDYTSAEHIARHFRQVAHLTPLAYRRKYGRR
jgi:LacI family transcriptional regulator